MHIHLYFTYQFEIYTIAGTSRPDVVSITFERFTRLQGASVLAIDEPGDLSGMRETAMQLALC